MYVKTMLAGWGDMDFNAHMRNTAYLDKSADLRMLFFAEHGFAAATFGSLRLGPVILRDELVYAREVGLLESIQVSLEIAGLAPDGSRFRIRNVFTRADGRLAATVNSDGGWLNLDSRKLVQPPLDLLRALELLPRTEDFVELPGSART